jgi:uncharacterized protein (TIGR03382 family)
MLALPLLVAGCAREPADSIGTTEQAIVYGSAASVGQFPTVVGIVVYPPASGEGGGLCTGTLVAPDIVLTAAHCVYPALLGHGSQSAVTDATRIVVDDVDLNNGFPTIRASETVRVSSFSDPGDPDIGLIYLEEEVTDRFPAPISFSRDDAPVGIETLLVGYGEDENGDFARLNFTDNKASEGCGQFGATDTRFLCYDQSDAQPGICSGDSGGPAFGQIGGVDRVIGIASWADGPADGNPNPGDHCIEVGGHFRTSDPAAIDFLMDEAPELVCRLDGACDDACGRDGLPADLDCATPCGNDDECAEEQYCDEDRGECVPDPGTTPGGIGAECEGGDDCLSGQCASGGGESLCTQACDDAGNDCPDGFDCTGGGLCWPAEDDGGCNAGGGASGGLAGLLLLGLALLRRRRA